MLGNFIYCLGGSTYFRLEVREIFSSYFAFLITAKIDVLVFSPGNTWFDLFGS